MSLSDREREAPRASKANGEARPVSEPAEGFHLTTMTAVAVAVTAQIVTSILCTDRLE